MKRFERPFRLPREVGIGVVGIAFAASQGCFDLDAYSLVDSVGGGGMLESTSAGPGGSPGMGGGGGSSSCLADGGALYVSFAATSDTSPLGADVCDETSTEPGISVIALSPKDGSCLAHTRIVSKSGAFDSAPLARFSHAAGAIVGGTFGGELELPDACVGGSVKLRTTDPSDRWIFLAALLQIGSTFCTAWQVAPEPLDSAVGNGIHLDALDVDDSEHVAIGGTLGGRTVEFDSLSKLTGQTFYALYASGVFLQGSVLAHASKSDSIFGLSSQGGIEYASGTVQSAASKCHSCTGNSLVTNEVTTCTEGQGGATASSSGSSTSSAGGVGGGGGASGGVGGSDGSGGGGAAPQSDDSFNAALWQPIGDACALDTFGSDQLGSSDAQVGFGFAFDPNFACSAYWVGLAGHVGFPLDSAQPAVVAPRVPNGTQQSEGAFIARVGAGQVLRCAGGGDAWGVRLTPSIAGAAAWGHSVAPRQCTAGVVATTIVSGASNGHLDLSICGRNKSCKSSASAIALSTQSGTELVVTDFDARGDLSWSGAFGQLAVDGASPPLPGRARDALAIDESDHSYLVFTTAGELTSENVDVSACLPTLVPGAAAGTFAVALDSTGNSNQAKCLWAHRLR